MSKHEQHRYPEWVCIDCGIKHGRKRPGLATWHSENCGICGKYKYVTEPRDFGHLLDGWQNSYRDSKVMLDCGKDIEAMTKPIRVQRRRTKGYRMPPNTVSVCRPGKFGNPFKVDECRAAGFQGTDAEIKQRCVEAFRAWLCNKDGWVNWQGDEAEKAKAAILNGLSELRGKNLACFCALSDPCHADVLLELANKTAEND